MYLESYHKILKHIYLEGKKVKRLDKTINAVLKIARDSLFKRLIKLSKNTRTEKLQDISRSHKWSKSISPHSIKVVKESEEWLVSSSAGTNEYHVIYNQDNNCSSKLCLLACPICHICIHTVKRGGLGHFFAIFAYNFLSVCTSYMNFNI